MKTVSLAEARAHLSKLVSYVAEGETVQITRRGKLVARLTPPEQPRDPIDMEALRALHRKSPPQSESAGDFFGA
jgi:prevent-host-death family protein